MSAVTVVRAAAGLGKTTLVLAAIREAIATGRGKSFEVYVPTHCLAEELAQKVREADPQLSVNVVGGRSHPGTDGEPLCKKHNLAADVASAGGDVYTSLCAREKGQVEERCEHYDGCPYISQFKAASITFYPQAYLPLERSRLEAPPPDTAIIDESFFRECIGKREVPQSLLRADFLGPSARRVCGEVERALIRGQPLLRHLYSVGISWAELEEAVKETRKGAPTMTPHMRENARRQALATMRRQNQVVELLTCLFRESFSGRSESHGLTYDPGTQKIAVHSKNAIPRFHERHSNGSVPPRESNVLIIDANAEEAIVGQFFKNATFHDVQTARQAEVIQCISTRCSTTSLVPARNTDPKSIREAKKRLGELEKFIARVAELFERVLVVGPQAITGNPNAGVDPLLKVPANVGLAHFNAIRGIDCWKDHDAAVVIGRNEPKIEDVEAIARSVYLNDKAPLRFAPGWTVENRGYRLKGRKLGVDVVRHPDPRIQLILEQLREGETQQAIDRLRLVHASEPKRIYLLSNVVLDLDVDCVVTWEEMMSGGSRIEQAWNTLEGVMPLAAAWLAARFPLLWKSQDAAKADARGWVKECRFTNIYSLSNPTLFRHQYRPTGATSQRAWSLCLSVHSDPGKTLEALEVLVGPVEMRPNLPAQPRASRARSVSSKSRSTRKRAQSTSSTALSTSPEHSVRSP